MAGIEFMTIRCLVTSETYRKLAESLLVGYFFSTLGMPALRAFGIKWKVGSDDFVFPYIGSVILRLFW